MNNIKFSIFLVRLFIIILFIPIFCANLIFPNDLIAKPPDKNTRDIYVLISYEGQVKGKDSPDDSIIFQINKILPEATFKFLSSMHVQKSDDKFFIYTPKLKARVNSFRDELGSVLKLFNTENSNMPLIPKEFFTSSNVLDATWYELYEYIKNNNFNLSSNSKTILGYVYISQNILNSSDRKLFPDTYSAELTDDAIKIVFSIDKYKEFLDKLSKQNKVDTPDRIEIPPDKPGSPEHQENLRLSSIPFNDLLNYDSLFNTDQVELIQYPVEIADQVLNYNVDSLRKFTVHQFSVFFKNLARNTQQFENLNKIVLPRLENKLDQISTYIESSPPNHLRIPIQIPDTPPNIASPDKPEKEPLFPPIFYFIFGLYLLLIPVIIFHIISIASHNKLLNKSVEIINNIEISTTDILTTIHENSKRYQEKFDAYTLSQTEQLPNRNIDYYEPFTNDNFLFNFNMLIKNILTENLTKTVPIKNLKLSLDKYNDNINSLNNLISDLSKRMIQYSNNILSLTSTQPEDSDSTQKHSEYETSRQEFLNLISSTHQTIQKDLTKFEELIFNLSKSIDKLPQYSQMETNFKNENEPIEFSNPIDTSRLINLPSPIDTRDQMIRLLKGKIPDVEAAQSDILKNHFYQLHPKFHEIDSAIRIIDKLVQANSGNPSHSTDSFSQDLFTLPRYSELFTPIKNAWIDIKRESGLHPDLLNNLITRLYESPETFVNEIEQRNELELEEKVSSFLNEYVIFNTEEHVRNLSLKHNPDLTLKLINIVRQVFKYLQNNISSIKNFYKSHQPGFSDGEIDDIIQDVFDFCGIKEIQITLGGSKFDESSHEDSHQPINCAKDRIPPGRIVEVMTPGYKIEWASIVLQKSLVKLSC